MTIHLIESWATYQNSADIVRRWPYQLGNGGQLSGGKCLIDGSVVSYCNTRTPTLKRVHIGMNVMFVNRAPTVQNSSFLHICINGETNNQNTIGLGMNPDGTLSVFYGPNFSGYGGTTLANGTTVIPTGEEVWIEIDVLQSKTNDGEVTVKIGDVTEISLTGIRTNPTNFAWAYVISLVAAANTQHIFGSLFISDGEEGFLGPCDVTLLPLNSDTAQNDFTPSSGAESYSLLTDLNNATTYVASSDLSAADRYGIAALPSAPSAIHAVQVRAKTLQNDAANRRKALLTLLKSAAAELGRGAAVPPASFPETWSKEPRGVFKTKPEGGAWDFAALSAIQVGFRVAPFVKGFNFRQTSGYVTDSPLCTYVLNDLYPTTRGGTTFGWDVAGSGTVALNRTTTNDKYAGINCQLNNGTQRTFRIDLPAAGRYQIRMAVGDYSFAHRQIYFRVSDGSTPLFTIDSTTNPDFVAASQSGVDAQGLHNYGLTYWEEYNAPREITMTGTVLNITIGSPTAGLDYTCLAHVELVALDLVQSLAAQTPEVQVAGLYVEALTSPFTAGMAQRPVCFVCT